MNPEDTDAYKRFEVLVQRLTQVPKKTIVDPEAAEPETEPSDESSGDALRDPRD